MRIVKNYDKIDIVERFSTTGFTCENLDVYIGSHDLFDFIRNKVNKIRSKVSENMETKKAFEQVEKELNFILFNHSLSHIG